MKTFFYICLIAGAVALPASDRIRNACFKVAHAVVSEVERKLLHGNMAEVKMVDGDEFEGVVKTPGRLVIVDIHHETTSIERSDKAELDKEISRLPSKVLVAKVLAGRNVELLDRLQIHNVPTMRVYRDGLLLEEFKGGIDNERFMKVVKYHMDNPNSQAHRGGYIGPISSDWLPIGVEERPTEVEVTPLEFHTRPGESK